MKCITNEVSEKRTQIEKVRCKMNSGYYREASQNKKAKNRPVDKEKNTEQLEKRKSPNNNAIERKELKPWEISTTSRDYMEERAEKSRYKHHVSYEGYHLMILGASIYLLCNLYLSLFFKPTTIQDMDTMKTIGFFQTIAISAFLFGSALSIKELLDKEPIQQQKAKL